MNELRMHVDTLSRLLGGFAYRYSREDQLHDRIAAVLEEAGWRFERERRLDAKNRLDFFVDGRIAVEVKVDGTASEALRQVDRYCAQEDVQAVLLASTQRWADMPLRDDVRQRGWHGKPVGIVRLRRQAL